MVGMGALCGASALGAGDGVAVGQSRSLASLVRLPSSSGRVGAMWSHARACHEEGDDTAMTDEEAAQLRAQVQEATRVLSGAYTISQARQAALTEEYAETFAAAVERLLAERAALVEIAWVVAHFDDDAYPDGAYCCHWCGAMYDGIGDRPTPHTADCPVTKARALLGAGEGETQP